MQEAPSAAKIAAERSTAPKPKGLRFVLWMQVLLILLTIGVYAYVWRGLKPLFAQREALKADIKNLTAEKATLIESNKTLRSEAKTYHTALNEVRKEVDVSGGKQLQEKVRQIAPLSEIRIRAAAEKTDKVGQNGSPIYNFSLWVEGPPSAMSRIGRVDYRFNHPTFRMPIVESTTRENQFRVGYTGWGCLSSVIVTITDPTEGITQTVDFDMCSALGW
jgi:hypothetical protein